MSLEQWLRNAWVQRLDPTLPEILQLFQVVDRELSDARAGGISPDGKFEHAYTAALQLCMLLLRAAGYQVPKSQPRHKRAIDSLRYTLGEAYAETADYLDRCSRQRGQAMYERVDVVRVDDADELSKSAERLRADVIRWLKTNHPTLVPPNV
jgi:hypothetical protein